MKPYEQYKYSGIEWLGQVPGHWEVKKLKYVLRLSPEKTESQKSDLRYIGMENIVSNTGELTESILQADGIANIFYQDEILFGKLRPYLAKVYLAQMDGIYSTEFLVYKTSKQIFNKFAFYLMICPSFIETVNSSTYGTKMPRANSDFLANLNIAIPPLPEQTAIAKFLDEKTTQIQTAIGIKNEQIAKLKEYRQALINQTVTKGLKANVAMKNSGVAWLGDVPEHWEVKKLKYVAEMNLQSLPENTHKNTVIQYVDIGSVSFENGIEKVEQFIFENAPSRARRMAKTGDTIVSTVRTYLKAISIITDEFRDCIFSTGFAVLSPKAGMDNKYLANFLKSDAFTVQVTLNSKGMSYPAINSTDLSNLWVALPPPPEQTAIAEFLDEKTAQIDTTIAQYQRQIERLKEYQQSLVNEAVTGKMRVSNLENNIGVN